MCQYEYQDIMKQIKQGVYRVKKPVKTHRHGQTITKDLTMTKTLYFKVKI